MQPAACCFLMLQTLVQMRHNSDTIAASLCPTGTAPASVHTLLRGSANAAEKSLQRALLSLVRIAQESRYSIYDTTHTPQAFFGTLSQIITLMIAMIG
jgi:hypothetical protein